MPDKNTTPLDEVKWIVKNKRIFETMDDIGQEVIDGDELLDSIERAIDGEVFSTIEVTDCYGAVLSIGSEVALAAGTRFEFGRVEALDTDKDGAVVQVRGGDTRFINSRNLIAAPVRGLRGTTHKTAQNAHKENINMTHRDQLTAVYVEVVTGGDGYVLVARDYEDDAPVATVLLGDDLPDDLVKFKDANWHNPFDLPIDHLIALHEARQRIVERRAKNERR